MESAFISMGNNVCAVCLKAEFYFLDNNVMNLKILNYLSLFNDKFMNTFIIANSTF